MKSWKVFCFAHTSNLLIGRCESELHVRKINDWGSNRFSFQPSGGGKSKVALEALREQEPLHDIAKRYQIHSTQVTEWKKEPASACERAVDIIERHVPLVLPSSSSNSDEVQRLAHLNAINLGAGAPATCSAAHGIFFTTMATLRTALKHFTSRLADFRGVFCKKRC
ncbi:hypothetical protein [Cerasicoccus maritimus]|uniref:hypothetical protein n=1 Tax=Cerasicoccus maritimus TaxID=490089 RepID=UPI0028528348|nr:hypothetical protein [Cerasicoccus maritimus]